MDHSIVQSIKDYIYMGYIAVVGYLGWNHRRLDSVILEQSKTAQKVESLEDTLDHVRKGVDKLIDHLLDNREK